VPLGHGLTLTEQLFQLSDPDALARWPQAWDAGRLVVAPEYRVGQDVLKRCLHLTLTDLLNLAAVEHLVGSCTHVLSRLYRRFGFTVVGKDVPLPAPGSATASSRAMSTGCASAWRRRPRWPRPDAMKALRQLWSHFAAHAEYLRNLPKAVGIVGAIAFPLFFALHELRGTKDYDSAWLRGTAALLCLGLALRDRWPARFKQWYVPWSYATFLFCLPFFNIFLALKNGGGSVAVANTFMAVFFLVLLADWITDCP